MKPKVLLVDDERAILSVASRILIGGGYDVTYTNSSDEAIRWLSREEFRAVVTDYHLTDGPGTAIVEAVRKGHPSTSIIIITGYKDDLPDWVKQGPRAVKVVEKPFTIGDLLSAVSEVGGVALAGGNK